MDLPGGNGPVGTGLMDKLEQIFDMQEALNSRIGVHLRDLD